MLSDRCEMAPSDRRLRAKEIRRLQVIRQVTHLGWDALPGIGFDVKDMPGAPAA